MQRDKQPSNIPTAPANRNAQSPLGLEMIIAEIIVDNVKIQPTAAERIHTQRFSNVTNESRQVWAKENEIIARMAIVLPTVTNRTQSAQIPGMNRSSPATLKTSPDTASRGCSFFSNAAAQASEVTLK